MQIPGHLTVALVQHSLPPFTHISPKARKNVMIPLLIASLFPDMVDKTIGYVFHAMPNGRHYAHNIFSLVGLSVLVGLFAGRMAGYAWFLGYLGHLLADSDRQVPWFFPLKEYSFPQGRLSFKLPDMVRETILLTFVLILRRSRYL
jgi:hypothetical protein